MLLKACKGKNTWCVQKKLDDALEYSKTGDFHIYYENGEPEIAMPVINGEMESVYGSIPKTQALAAERYFDIIKHYILKIGVIPTNSFRAKMVYQKIKSGEFPVTLMGDFFDLTINHNSYTAMFQLFEEDDAPHGFTITDEFEDELFNLLEERGFFPINTAELGGLKMLGGRIELKQLEEVCYFRFFSGKLIAPNLTKIYSLYVDGEITLPSLQEVAHLCISDHGYLNAPKLTTATDTVRIYGKSNLPALRDCDLIGKWTRQTH